MTTPAKIDLILGAYQLLRISGLTVDPQNEDIILALNVMDDWAAEQSTMYDTGYLQPAIYGESDPNDQSGIDRQIAGPFKKVLAAQLAVAFGKEVTPTLGAVISQAMDALEQHLVTIEPSQNPATLPIGSGNEHDYRSNKFYPEPNNDDGAVNKYEDEVFSLNLDWTSFVGSNTLVSVSYENDTGIALSGQVFDGVENTSSVTISFNHRGQFQLCVSATDDAGNVEARRFIYNSVSCIQKNSYYPYG